MIEFSLTVECDSKMSEKYYTTIENVKTTLELHGVAIIPGILDPEECRKNFNEV